VFGLLAGNAARLIVSYLIHSYRPHLSLDLGKAKELFGFGKWILGTSIITFLFNQGDDAFLGKVLGVTALGFYQMAYQIGQVPATEFAKVISKVTLPAYSKLQDNLPKLRKGYLKTLNITVVFMIPLSGGIFMLAPEFTTIFLGGKWMPMIPALRILIIAGIIRALVTTGGALFQGKGSPNIDFKMNLVRLFVMLIIIYPLTLFFDMCGVALAVALGNFACIPIWFNGIVKIIRTSFKDFFKIIFPPFLGTISMCLFLLILKPELGANLFHFVLMVILAAGVYSAFIYLFEKMFDIKILDELRSLVHSLTKSVE
jgi:O-antigen/teichoic acid export membrane protein